MKVLLLGATGATGFLLLDRLLCNNISVRAPVRSIEKILPNHRNNPNLELIDCSPSLMSKEAYISALSECDAVALCLGHNMSFKGIWSFPHHWLTNIVQKLLVVSTHHQSVKFIMMSSAGVVNKKLPETIPFSQKLILFLIRWGIPPHRDNERAAQLLSNNFAHANNWVVVRPDTLISSNQTTQYSIHPSPTRSAIFNAGDTSRINVADFMFRLITEETLWQQWRGQMPVIYNQ